MEINSNKFSKMVAMKVDNKKEMAVSTIAYSKEIAHGGCEHCHCGESSAEHASSYNIVSLERKLWDVEELGTESPYRCVACRACAKCRNGDELEMVSLREESEQAQIECSVELKKKKIYKFNRSYMGRAASRHLIVQCPTNRADSQCESLYFVQ